MTRAAPALRRLAADRRGATIIEFAIVAPVMVLLILGLGDLMYQIYAQSLLDGAVQKAARDSALEGGSDQASTFDDRVLSMVKLIAPNATYASQRKSYSTFSSVKPEDFTDKNKNGVCDNGESFTDINGNKTWDLDPGIGSQGGADDVVKYTMNITYPRLFPMGKLLGWSDKVTISSSTYLKNQPYDTQVVPGSNTYTCK